MDGDWAGLGWVLGVDVLYVSRIGAEKRYWGYYDICLHVFIILFSFLPCLLG